MTERDALSPLPSLPSPVLLPLSSLGTPENHESVSVKKQYGFASKEVFRQRRTSTGTSSESNDSTQSVSPTFLGFRKQSMLKRVFAKPTSTAPMHQKVMKDTRYVTFKETIDCDSD